MQSFFNVVRKWMGVGEKVEVRPPFHFELVGWSLEDHPRLEEEVCLELVEAVDGMGLQLVEVHE